MTVTAKALTLDEARNATVVTPDEYAATLRMGRRQVYEALRAGEIPAIRSGRNYKITGSHLRQVLGIEPRPQLAKDTE